MIDKSRIGFENVFAQPVVDMKSGKTLYQEVFYRLRDIDWKRLSIEDEYSIYKAILPHFSILCENADENLGLNISLRLLRKNPKIIEDIAYLLPKGSVLEITENYEEKIDELGAIANDLQELRKVGLKIAIDDYGKDNSNFKRLCYEFDYLKLDGDWVKLLRYGNGVIRNYLAFIVKEFGAEKIIAEMVENKEESELLLERGIVYQQGYFIRKPIKIAGIAGKVLEENIC